jgi:hypothetical protein
MKKIPFIMCLLIMAICAVNAQRGVEKVSFTPIPLPNVLDLPGPLPDVLRQGYPGFVVGEAYKGAKSGTDVLTYKIKLTNGNINRTLIYDQNGTYYKMGIDNVSLTPIQLPNVMYLPGPLPDFLRQNYPGFAVNEAFQVVTANNVITYELGIGKGATAETLIFDSNGQFIRKNAGQVQRKNHVSRIKR